MRTSPTQLPPPATPHRAMLSVPQEIPCLQMLGMNLLEPWWTHGLPWKRGEQEWRTMGRNSGPENDRRNLAGRWFNEHLGLKAKKWPGCCSRFGDRNSWSYHSAVSLSRVSWLRTTPLHVNRGRRNHIWRRECMCVCKKQEDDFTEYGYEDWGWYSYLFMNMCWMCLSV